MAITTHSNGTIMITGEYDTHLAAMIAQKYAIRLEALGMRHSKGSVTARVKRAYGFKGNRAKVLEQLQAKIDEYAKGRPNV